MENLFWIGFVGALIAALFAWMQAKRVLLIASGADKAEAIRNSFFGPVTPQVPASILQFHRDVIVIADEAALADCPAEA